MSNFDSWGETPLLMRAEDIRGQITECPPGYKVMYLVDCVYVSTSSDIKGSCPCSGRKDNRCALCTAIVKKSKPRRVPLPPPPPPTTRTDGDFKDLYYAQTVIIGVRDLMIQGTILTELQSDVYRSSLAVLEKHGINAHS
jgi:hypothetical protein